jgi:protein-disulfide isomerase
VKEPTEEEITAFYEANKARVNQPKEKLTVQIRQYLQRQASAKARREYIDGLKKEHGAVSYLEPFRAAVANSGFPSVGPADAPVQLVEFSDFECSFCKAFSATLKEVLKNYPTQVRLVYRHFPLEMHPSARKAAEASLCAADQGKFWELHDAMLSGKSPLGVEDLKKTAAGLNLDAAAFNACLDSGRHAPSISRDVREGYLAGVNGTPALFVNGRFLSGAQPYAEIVAVIEDELKRKAATTKP